MYRINFTANLVLHIIEISIHFKGRRRIRPQIGPLTFLKIFVLEMIYSGTSQRSEPSYIIGLDHFHVTLCSIFVLLIIRE